MISHEDIVLLNGWPESTLGYEQEAGLIIDLYRLGEKHGFGRVSQLARHIENLKNKPDATREGLRNMRELRLKLLEEKLSETPPENPK